METASTKSQPTPPSREATAPTGAGGEAERFHSLDALRAFALLLGVVFHAAESFEPGVEVYWAIADSSSSPLLGLFRHACHSFRLETFFLIAGFFARLLYHRRGARAFIRNRVSRILVPLVVGWVILYPILVYLWMLGASVSGRLEESGIPAQFAQTPLPLLVVGFFASFEFVRRFDLTHLWFLHQLLVVYACFLPVRGAWHRWVDPEGRKLAWLDRGLAWLSATRWNVLLLAVVTVPLLRMMQSGGVDTPKASLLPYVPTTLLFGFQFSLGWLLHRQTALLETFAARWWLPMLLALLMVWPSAVGPSGWAAIGLGPLDPWASSLFRTFIYALMMWGFVLGFLGLFVRHRRHASAAWRYVADSSYWIYLVHLPLVVLLQIAVARWPLSWMVKYPLILVVSMPLLFLSYDLLARSTFIGAQLNGRKYPRVLGSRSRESSRRDTT